MCRWVQTHECCECYRGEGGADTEVSGRRYTPPAQQFQCYVTKLRLYFYLYCGVALRQLLKLDAESEEAKPSHVVMSEQQQRISELETEVKAKVAAVKLLQDAWRKSASRLKKKGKALTEARAKQKEALKALMPKLKEEAEARVADDIANANRLKKQANARARKAEKAEATAKRKIAKLEQEMEDGEMEDDADDEMDLNDSDEPETHRAAFRAASRAIASDAPVSPLLFEVLPRKDERGRFQAESPELHELRIAQLARGGDPSIVSQNIQDVLAHQSHRHRHHCHHRHRYHQRPNQAHHL